MKITIIGGGTAGWLAALYITRKQPGHTVTVIDSSKLGIIGVGEGTTGIFMDIIQNLDCDFGINEAEFIQETGATAKMGIRFTNWQGKGDNWIAPIDNMPTHGSEHDHGLIDWVAQHGTERAHLSTVCGLLADRKLSSIDLGGNSTYAQGAYHFDGHKVGQYFKKIAAPLCLGGVIDSEIVSWAIDSATGTITSVLLANGETVTSDYWIDCSGFARVLAEAVDPGWHSYRDRLTCNSALLFRTELTKHVEPTTLAAAMQSGWRFRIPTQERYGNGYIFDSSVIDQDRAAEELLAQEPGAKLGRVIKFDPGRMERPFCKNVAFIGLSSVFLEPLQATSIHGTIAQLQHLTSSIIRPHGCLPQGSREYDHINQVVNRTFDQFADLLQLHYQSGRTDTEFWRRQTYEVERSDQVEYLRDLSQRRWPVPGDFFINRAVAGYSVFIYPMLAYGWINVERAKDVLRASTLHQLYHWRKLELADRCLSHDEFLLRARTNQLSSLTRAPLPQPQRPVNNYIHPLLR